MAKLGTKGAKALPVLQKWQKNELLETLKERGLDAAEFTLKDSKDEVRIKHKRSASRFIVRNKGGGYVGSRVAGELPETSYDAASWQGLVTSFSAWSSLVKFDLDTPDLWAELQHDTKLLTAASNKLIDNRPFAPNEQKEIAERLEKVMKSVCNAHSLSKTQIEGLEAGVDYLVDASVRLGRKDWLNAFIGAIFGYVLTATLPPESARTILTTFLRGVGLLYPELPLLE
jgi:hypothetical protein